MSSSRSWESIASVPVRRRLLGRFAPAIVSALIVLLASLTISSSVIVVRHFRNEAQSITRLSYGVYAALSDPREGAGPDSGVSSRGHAGALSLQPG